MNDLDRYPLTRVRVLDRLRGLRRSARKLRDKLKEQGPLDNKQRHEIYSHAEALVTYTENAIRLLDEARPPTKKEASCRKRKKADA